MLQQKVGVIDAKPKIYEDYLSRIDRTVNLFYEEMGQIQKRLREDGKREMK